MSEAGLYVTGIALSQFVIGAETLGIGGKSIIATIGLGDAQLVPSARVPEPQYEMALLQLILASNNDSFGVAIGQQLMPPLYGVLTSLAFSSPTLGEALKNMAQYQAIASGNCGNIEYQVTDSSARFCISMSHRNPVVRRHVAECVLTAFSNLLRLMSGRQDFSPSEIWLEHEPFSKSTQRNMEVANGCPVHWGKGSNLLVLDQRIHDYPIHGHGDEMLRSATQLAQQQLEALNQRSSVLDSIKWHANQLMDSGTPRREIVAERLGISTRTLDRRLKAADLTWQEMLTGLRAQRAIDYLTENKLSIADIAEKLGYTDSRAFQRGFKTWTGMTPSEYRTEILGG